MSKRMSILRSLIVAVLLSSLLTGCVKMKNQVLVMPDGSGKIILTVTVNESMLSQALASVEALLGGSSKRRIPKASEISASAINVDGIERSSEGLVAFSEPKQHVQQGWRTISLVGYFEDINNVKIRTDKTPEVALSFAFKEDGDGYVLDVTNKSLEKLTSDSLMGSLKKATGAEVPPQIMAAMGPMVKGFSVTEAYKLPGPVTDAKGLPRTEGRVAGMALGEGFLTNVQKAREIAAQTERSITCGPSQIGKKELRDFKRELELARADWEERKAKQEK
jgi:hypothetical protein